MTLHKAQHKNPYDQGSVAMWPRASDFRRHLVDSVASAGCWAKPVGSLWVLRSKVRERRAVSTNGKLMSQYVCDIRSGVTAWAPQCPFAESEIDPKRTMLLPGILTEGMETRGVGWFQRGIERTATD